MPISYALLLCIPIGVVFFLMARPGLRYVIGHYERPERRAALLFGLFGALIIPNIWIGGCLEEEFPTISEWVFSSLLSLAEISVIAGLIRHSYTRSRDEAPELKERDEP